MLPARVATNNGQAGYLRYGLRSARGLTLVELLTVILIVALLMGLSGAAYWRMSRSMKEQAVAAELDVAIRHARNSALTANAPAFVEIDVEERRVVPWAYRTVGTWHFEEGKGVSHCKGPYHEALVRGAQMGMDGKIGKCAQLKDSAYIELGSDPDFDFTDGGFLEAYVRASTYSFGGEDYIFSKKNAYSLKVGKGGVLIGNAGNQTIESTYRLVPGRWTKVAFAWDRQSTRLIIDDGIVAIGTGSKPPMSDYPLILGHETASFEGQVDEVRIMSADAGSAVNLSRNWTITHNFAPWKGVYFAPDGSLDMRFHAGPVVITLTQSDKVRTVNISMLGTTTRSEADKVEKPEIAEAPVEQKTASGGKNRP